MKILHTGDLHLDSPFSGLDISLAATRRRELRQTFSSMMSYARTEGIDMVIIAGDLVDSTFVTRETIALLIKEFASLSCPVIITPGNHDPADEASIWKKSLFSENVHVFSENSLSRLDFPHLGCSVYGYAFTSPIESTCKISGEVCDKSLINILAAHCDTSAPIGRYAPTPVSAIRAFGADYAALGHIHTPDSANAALAGLGAYCGCPEGRDFGECGEKGALIVDIEKSGESAVVKTEKKRFCKRIYSLRELSVDAAASMGEVLSKIKSFANDFEEKENTLLRINLTGCVDSSLVINTAALCEDNLGFFALEVQDSTLPTWNSAALLADKGINGEVFRVLLPALESENREERDRASLALRYAIAALNGEDISDM